MKAKSMVYQLYQFPGTIFGASPRLVGAAGLGAMIAYVLGLLVNSSVAFVLFGVVFAAGHVCAWRLTRRDPHLASTWLMARRFWGKSRGTRHLVAGERR